MLGDQAERLKDSARGMASEGYEKVKSVAQRTYEAATETLKGEAENQGLTGSGSGSQQPPVKPVPRMVRKMAGIPARPRTVIDDPYSRRRPASKWKARLASAGLAALLLAIGARCRRDIPAAEQAMPVSCGPAPPHCKTICSGALPAHFRRSDRLYFSRRHIFLAARNFPGHRRDCFYLRIVRHAQSECRFVVALEYPSRRRRSNFGRADQAAGRQRPKSTGHGGDWWIPVSIWSANAGIKSLFDALNIVLKEKETRGFFKLNAVSLVFTSGRSPSFCGNRRDGRDPGAAELRRA